MNPKLTFAAALAATLLAIAGCGGSDSTSADKEQDVADITALVADINQVTRDKDAQGYCALLQPSGVTAVFNTQAQCVRETTKILEQTRGKEPALKIEDIETNGDNATVTLANNAAGAPLDLVREGGRWYVPLSDDGTLAAPAESAGLPDE